MAVWGRADAAAAAARDSSPPQRPARFQRPARSEVACCFAAAWLHYMWLCVFFSVLTLVVVFPTRTDDDTPSDSPGDATRRALEPDVLAALASNNWDGVREAFEGLQANCALMIGDASGVRFEAENGWISLDTKYSIASQSKVVAALTIYRLARRSGGALAPTSPVRDFVPEWPAENGATLEHLLGFTTGFTHDEKVTGFGTAETCARRPEDEQPSWEACVREIAALPLAFAPGESFVYGPWHLVVAAAMAHRALDRPLTRAAWARSVEEEVFAPAGISGRPDYCGVTADFPAGFPWFGAWYTGGVENRFPDFSAGLCMSGRDLRRFQHELLFNEPDLANFTRDRTRAATAFRLADWDEDDLSFSRGTWHYAQGAWLACDAAADARSTGLVRADELCGDAPSPRVVHSFGIWGCYAWIDLTNGYYGVFMHSWAVDLRNMFWIGLSLSVTCACAFGALCARVCAARCCAGCVGAPNGDPLEAGPIVAPLVSESPSGGAAPTQAPTGLSASVVTVVVPPGVEPGALIDVPLPDGRRLRVGVPEGAAPGSQFQVAGVTTL